MRRLLFVPMFFLCAALALRAEVAAPKPEVWMMPFSLIYWAADYPHLQRRELADDATWYISIMRQGNDYALVGGAPDEYVIESWVGAPSCAVPETGDWTFTRSAQDFCKRFVQAKKQPH